MDFRNILPVCDIKWMLKVCCILVLIVVLIALSESVNSNQLRGTLEIDSDEPGVREMDVQQRQNLKQDILFRKVN